MTMLRRHLQRIDAGSLREGLRGAVPTARAAIRCSGVALTAGLIVLGGCSDPEPEGLGSSELSAIEGTEDLVRAVAVDGVDGAAAAELVARVSSDPIVVLELASDFVDMVPRFASVVLDADPLQLPTLVALGIDGVTREAQQSGIDLTTLSEEQAAIEANQRDFLEGATFDFDDYLRALRQACDERGLGPGDRWAAVRAVMQLATTATVDGGSFLTTIGGDLAAVDLDTDVRVPDNVPGLNAEIGEALSTVLAAALYEDPDVRALLVGDVDPAAFAADPFIVDVLNLDDGALGRPVVEDLFAFVTDD